MASGVSRSIERLKTEEYHRERRVMSQISNKIEDAE